MQQELDAEGLPVRITIVGINEAGRESGNALICDGRDLPWLQDTVDDGVWASWSVTFRDVIILDDQNVAVDVFNLTSNNLADSSNRDALKDVLKAAAGL